MTRLFFAMALWLGGCGGQSDDPTIDRPSPDGDADGEAQACVLEAVRPCNHHEEGVRGADAGAVHGIELRLVGEASLPRQAESCGRES